MSRRCPANHTRRRPLGRVAAAAVGAFAFLPALSAATPAAAATTVNWATIGWSDASAGPQQFDDVVGSGVGMTVSYSTNMWDGVPNVYGAASPITPYDNSLRFTNDRVNPDSETTVTITFDEPVLVNDLRVGSLSELGTMWEWVEVTGNPVSGTVDHTTIGVSTSTYDTGGAYTTPGTPAVTSISSGSVIARGTSRQGAGAAGYEAVPEGYDNLHLDFGSTPIASIELSHFATAGPEISDPRSSAFASIIVDLLDVDVVPVVATPDYDLALANVISASSDTSITYAITVCNQGDAPSGAFTVTDELAPGTAFASASNAGTANGNIVTWSIPASDELAPGECMTLTVTVDVDQSVVTSPSCINTAEISADSGDDIDSTPDTVLTGAGADDLIDITDASGLANAASVDGDEDDHDIAVCAAAPTTTLPPTTTTTGPDPAGPTVDPILPVTGTDSGGVTGLAVVIMTLGASLLFVAKRARYTGVHH